MQMLRTDASAAKEYLITSEYVSQCREVVENPRLALDLPDQPDEFESKYATNAERAMMKNAIQMALTAYIQQQGGLK